MIGQRHRLLGDSINNARSFDTSYAVLNNNSGSGTLSPLSEPTGVLPTLPASGESSAHLTLGNSSLGYGSIDTSHKLQNNTSSQINSSQENLISSGLDTNSGTAMASSAAPVSYTQVAVSPGESSNSSAVLSQSGQGSENASSSNQKRGADVLAAPAAPTSLSGTIKQEKHAEGLVLSPNNTTTTPASVKDHLWTESPRSEKAQTLRSDKFHLPASTSSATVAPSLLLYMNGRPTAAGASSTASQGMMAQKGGSNIFTPQIEQVSAEITAPQAPNTNRVDFPQIVKVHAQNVLETAQRTELLRDTNSFFLQALNNEFNGIQNRPFSPDVISQNLNRIPTTSVSMNRALLGTGLEMLPESLRVLGIAPFPNAHNNMIPAERAPSSSTGRFNNGIGSGTRPLSNAANPVGSWDAAAPNVASTHDNTVHLNMPHQITGDSVVDYVLQGNTPHVTQLNHPTSPTSGNPLNTYDIINALRRDMARALGSRRNRVGPGPLDYVSQNNPPPHAVMNISYRFPAQWSHLSSVQPSQAQESSYPQPSSALFSLPAGLQSTRRRPRCRFPCVFYLPPPATDLFYEIPLFFRKVQPVRPTGSSVLSVLLHRAASHPDTRTYQ